jgi:hypothetical protein
VKHRTQFQVDERKARLVERAFGRGAAELTEAVQPLGERLEAA